MLLHHSDEERCVSPFNDENQLIRSMPPSDLLTLAAHDHVTSESLQPRAEVRPEPDVYYYEEELLSVDVVCDLTQMRRALTRDDLITSAEERAVSPIQGESVSIVGEGFELVSLDAVDHVVDRLDRAVVSECDLYYYEEESFTVDVVCDITQRLLEQHSASDYSVEERISSDVVRLEADNNALVLTEAETAAVQAADIPPSDVDVAATLSSSETFVLPRVRQSSTNSSSSSSRSSCCCCCSTCRWRGSVTVRTLDLRSRGRGFDSRSDRYHVVSTWMGDCLRTGKPSRYITTTKVNSAFYLSGVGKSSSGLHGWGLGGARSPVSGGR